MTFATLSKHAQQRCQQRGIQRQDVELLLKEYDIVQPARDGSSLVRISRDKARRLASKRNGLNARRIEKLGAIVCDFEDRVVTLMHLTPARLKRV